MWVRSQSEGRIPVYEEMSLILICFQSLELIHLITLTLSMKLMKLIIKGSHFCMRMSGFKSEFYMLIRLLPFLEFCTVCRMTSSLNGRTQKILPFTNHHCPASITFQRPPPSKDRRPRPTTPGLDKWTLWQPNIKKWDWCLDTFSSNNYHRSNNNDSHNYDWTKSCLCFFLGS